MMSVVMYGVLAYLSGVAVLEYLIHILSTATWVVPIISINVFNGLGQVNHHLLGFIIV